MLKRETPAYDALRSKPSTLLFVLEQASVLRSFSEHTRPPSGVLAILAPRKNATTRSSIENDMEQNITVSKFYIVNIAVFSLQ